MNNWHGQQQLQLDKAALELLANAADGDARRALNLLEIANDLAFPMVTRAAHSSPVDQVWPIPVRTRWREASRS